MIFHRQNLPFDAFSLNYDKISEDYNHHTNPTLKKFVLLSPQFSFFEKGVQFPKVGRGCPKKVQV